MAATGVAAHLLYQKLAIGLSTILISLVFGLLPYRLSRTREEASADYETGSCCSQDDGKAIEDPTMPPKWLSWATSFGGGVFLGAALLHLLPEASEILDGDFPRANLLCSLGFLMVLGLEEIMPHAESTQNTNESSSLALVAALSFHSLFDGLAIGSTTSNGQLKAVSIAILAHKPISAFSLGSILVCKKLVSSQPAKAVEFTKNAAPELEHNVLQDRPDAIIDRRKSMRRLSSSRRSMAYYYFKYAQDDCEDTASCSRKECVCKDLLLFNENGSTVPQPESAMGMTTLNGDYGSIPVDVQPGQNQSNNFPIVMIIYIIFFSVTSFIGTIIGALGLQYIESSQLGQKSTTTSPNALGAIVATTFQSLAAGSFLYAATMEALVKERGDHHKHHYHHHEGHDEGGHQVMVRTNRVGAALVGVAAMASIRTLEA